MNNEPGMLEKLASRCYRSRRLVVLAWVAVLVGLSAVGSVAAGETDDEFLLPGSETQQAVDLLAEEGFASRAGAEGQVVLFSDAEDPVGGLDDPDVRRAVADLVAGIEAEVDGAEVADPFTPGGEHQVSADGTTAYLEIGLTERPLDEVTEAAATVRGLRADLVAALPELQVELGGQMFLGEEEADFSREAFGLLAAVVVLLVAFGSVLAAGLPVVVAILGAGCGMAVISLSTNVVDMPSFTAAAAAMVAIGVGIDYALLIVTRYREALGDGLEPHDAVVRAQATAGRSVLFAGVTVVIAVLGLLLMGLGLLNGVAVGIAASVLMTMLASLTLLPALLGFAGRRIDRFGLPHRTRRSDRPTAAVRWSRIVQRRPVTAFVASLALLLLLAVPAAGMRLGFSDAGSGDPSETTRRAYDLVANGFGPGTNGSLVVAAQTPEGADVRALDTLAADLGAARGVADVSPVVTNDTGTAALLVVVPTTGPQDADTTDLVHRMRDDVIPAALDGSGVTALVGGATSGAIDYADGIADRLPLFVGVVLALSALLLLVVFRSVLVPLKAVVVNLVSLAATFGVTVAVFQWGWGADLIGVEAGPIEAWVPMMVFAVAFGLSMDYEVFLLSRIREEYDRGLDNSAAVAEGLSRTARVITAAAAVMVCVFGSFVLGSARDLQLFGFALAVAVLLDATVVRMVLVPATMELLGDRNWWLPGWLVHRLPRVRFEAPAVPVDRELART